MIKQSDFKKTQTETADRALADMLTAMDWARDKDKHLVVGKALGAARHQAVARKIENCGDGHFCSSLYCGKCRRRWFNRLHETFRTRLSRELEGEDKTARKRLRFATVLLDVVPYEAAAVGAALEDARSKRDKLSRKLKSKDVWMRGIFELEPIDFGAWDKVEEQLQSDGKNERAIRAALRKRETLIELADKKGRSTRGKAVLVHFHGLVDCGTVSSEEVYDLLHEEYGLVRRAVDLKELFGTKSVEKTLEALATYMFKGTNQKDWRRYKIGWTTNETRKALEDLVKMERGLAQEARRLSKSGRAKRLLVDPDTEGHVPPNPDDLDLVTLGQFIALDHAVFGENPKSRHVGLG